MGAIFMLVTGILGFFFPPLWILTAIIAFFEG